MAGVRLYLLRHAKSSWDDPYLPDHERPLAPRGITATKRLAEHFRAADVAPDAVLCSAALRTRQTWAGVSPGVRSDPEVAFEERLYAASAQALLRRLHGLAGPRSVMVIAHNPGLWDLAENLSGSGDGDLRQRLSAHFPTGAFVTLDLAGPWDGVQWGSGTLVDFVVPRDLS